MPVCIAGMHRSGTSMLAKLLHKSGLYLGPEAEFLPGLWENRQFANINARILKLLGGHWDDPPPAPEGWAERRLDRMRARAEAVLVQFADYEPWGWKDPRTCLTLPFWQSMLGAIPVVIIVRNPLEVAESLHRRNGFALAHGLALWHEYNGRLSEAAAPSDRIVTHYEAHFQHPEREARRLLTFVGLPVDAGAIAAASGTRDARRRHHRRTTRDLVAAGAAPAVVELYRQLCQEADWSDGDLGSVAARRTGPAFPVHTSRRPAVGPS